MVCFSLVSISLSLAYGHGAIATALYLADNKGADAFAVATLQEAIALRKAFQETSSTNSIGASVNRSNPSMSSLFSLPTDDISLSTRSMSTGSNRTNGIAARKRSLRPSNIRILVLGPPVGFPRCFDEYFHHNIEVMISGPEVAKALYEWVHDPNERKRTQVERAAAESKEMARKGHHHHQPQRPIPPPRNGQGAAILEHRDSLVSEASASENSASSETQSRSYVPSATLGNVTGSDLAKEVREILKNQEKQQVPAMRHPLHSRQVSGSATPSSSDSWGVTPVSSECDMASKTPNGCAKGAPQVFPGIEEAARLSRNFQKAVAREAFIDTGDDDDESPGDMPSSPITPKAQTNRNKKAFPPTGIPRKRLRWHAVVDSGMGRLGFRTDPVRKDELGKRRDSVEVIKELVDLEAKFDCPIEFFGMMTHMADANSTSDYTHAQIAKFKALLKRVRAAGISVPTLSTDNSAALLTPTLTHFDPKELLTQEYADTRGFVRIGGAIYGQRPAFPQLRAVSTLTASVRHVATLKKGESVGYDRAYVADGNVRIATLAIGFADGYPRELGNSNGQVAIRGTLFPVVGNVCMDMMMVSLGDAGDKNGPGAEVVVGDTAILWGPADDEEGEGRVRLQDIATKLKTTQSALTCGLDKERVLRVYA